MEDDEELQTRDPELPSDAGDYDAGPAPTLAAKNYTSAPVMSRAEIERLGGTPVADDGIPTMSRAEIERLGGTPHQPPEAAGMVGTAVRRFAHNIIPGALGVVGGTIGAGFANLPGAVAGGVGAFEAGHYLQNKALKMLGIDDSLQMAADAEANPKTAITADIASTLPFFGVGSAPRMAVNAVRGATSPGAAATALRGAFAGEAGTAALKEAGIGAGIGGTLEGVNQAIEGHFDPTRLGTAIATGGVLTRPMKATQAIERSVGQMAGRATGRPDLWPDHAAAEARAAEEGIARARDAYRTGMTQEEQFAKHQADYAGPDRPQPDVGDLPGDRWAAAAARGADPAQASTDGGVNLHQGQQPRATGNVSAEGIKTPKDPTEGPVDYGKVKPPTEPSPAAAGEWKSDPAVDLALKAALEPKTPAAAAAPEPPPPPPPVQPAKGVNVAEETARMQARQREVNAALKTEGIQPVAEAQPRGDFPPPTPEPPPAAVPPKAEAAIARSRGRPRKTPLVEPAPVAEAPPPAVTPLAEAAIARSRGRPRKTPPVEAAAAERAPDEVLRGPLAREVAKQHMPWYDEGYQGRPRGGNEAEQAAWDRGANDRMNADRTAGGDKPAAADAPVKSEPKPAAAADALQAIERAMAEPKAAAAERAQVERAYFELTGGKSNQPVSLAEIRAKLPNADRNAVDAAFKELHLEPGSTLVENNNPRAITPAMREGALDFQGIPKHQLVISRKPNTAPTDLAKSVEQLKKTAAGPAPAKEPPAKFTIAKDVETGEHVLFRNDVAKESFTTRGAAEKARNKAAISEALVARKPAQQQQQRQAGGPETGAPPKPAREEVTVAPSGEKPELTPSDITERIGALDPHASPAEHLAEVRYLEQQARANGMPLAEKLKSHIDAYETEVNRGEREPSGPAAESGKQYAQQTQPSTPPLEPATKSDLQQGLFASLRRQFGGALTQGSESQQTARAALRKAYGPLARLREQTATRFTNELHQLANKMDQPGFEHFVDAYETGKQASLPADQQPLAKVLGKNYDDFWDAVKKHPGTDEMEATKNFLTHMYDNTSGQVDKFTGEWFGAGGGSLRARKHPTFADARAAGLKPLSNNPIEHFVRYSEGISNYLAQRQTLADLTSQNRIGYFGPKIVGASGTPAPQVKGAPPEGYAEIKMPWAQKNGQRAYAPRDIAETLNQFYDAGLRRSQTKDIYEFAQQTKNAWTAIELGLSAYHATTMGVESVASGMSRALQIAATGDYKRATAQLLRAPIEPVTSYLYGKQGRNIYRDATGTQGTPMQRRIIDIFTQANVQPGNRSLVGEYGAPGSNSTMREYDMSKLGNFWDAHKRGSLPNEIQAQMKSIVDSKGLTLPKVLLDNIRRATQTISKPLFEHYIPELKLGTMMKDMEAWFHANPNATDAQALKYARKISDSVDNRMGEMNYDNLFMNKTAKDIGMLSLRSFGFTVGGPIREIGAGVGRLALTAAQRQNPLKHFDLRSEAADPRTAYAMAFLPAIAAISAVYQYMRTGKGPEDWRDLVTPQTGGTVKSVGKQVPERVLVPGYHKDFLGYFVNPSGVTGELEAKLAAPWTAIKEQLTGKDWRDKPYVPPRATTLEWIQAHAKQLGSHMLPIGPKQVAEGKRQGSALTYPEQAIGVRTPGAYMLNPKGLEQFLSNQRQRDWKAKEKQDNSRRMEQGLPPNPIRPFPRAP